MSLWNEHTLMHVHVYGQIQREALIAEREHNENKRKIKALTETSKFNTTEETQHVFKVRKKTDTTLEKKDKNRPIKRRGVVRAIVRILAPSYTRTAN